MNILCHCGCGTEVPPPSRATAWRLKSGQIPGVYLPGHNSRGSDNPRWRGGESDSNGYRLVRAPAGHPNARKTGYILEHRLVMSLHLGRPLLDTELVHHKNEDKRDNRVENLELTHRPEHTAHHSAGPKNGKWVEMPPKECGHCRQPFVPAHRCNYKRAKFCTIACRDAYQRGARGANTRLTDAQVQAIRELGGQMKQRDIAKRFGVSKTQVGRILRGESRAGTAQ